jgi:hypothetical protein
MPFCVSDNEVERIALAISTDPAHEDFLLRWPALLTVLHRPEANHRGRGTAIIALARKAP